MILRSTAVIAAALALAICFIAFQAADALAHEGHAHEGGFVSGFQHPLGGIDHLLAMLAVGLLAANLGGRALFLIPACFVGVMATGGALSMAGFALPYVEFGIVGSVVVLGAALLLNAPIPLVATMAIVGFFALFHGHAHGAEMPSGASEAAYAAGFVIATALLHAIGLTAGVAVGLLDRSAAHRFGQVAGVLIVSAGLGLMTGWL